VTDKKYVTRKITKSNCGCLILDHSYFILYSHKFKLYSPKCNKLPQYFLHVALLKYNNIVSQLFLWPLNLISKQVIQHFNNTVRKLEWILISKYRLRVQITSHQTILYYCIFSNIIYTFTKYHCYLNCLLIE
jgi:hypothetical protein